MYIFSVIFKVLLVGGFLLYGYKLFIMYLSKQKTDPQLHIPAFEILKDQDTPNGIRFSQAFPALGSLEVWGSNGIDYTCKIEEGDVELTFPKNEGSTSIKVLLRKEVKECFVS